MHQEPPVALARWDCPQTAASAGDVERGLSEFARRQGIGAIDRLGVGAAVAEAVASALDDVGDSDAPRHVRIDAATDGHSVSVRICAEESPRVTDPCLALPLASALASRIESGPPLTGPGWAVLLEFGVAATRRAPGRPQACVARWRSQRRAPRRRARRDACARR